MENLSRTEVELKEFSAVKARRAKWEALWDMVAKFILKRKVGFAATPDPGSFYQQGDVYDETAPQANVTMCSSLVGALWRNGARTFRIARPKDIPDSTENKEYYEKVNNRVIKQMEHEKAGFGIAYQEYMLENGAFGTSGLGVFPAKEGSDHLVEYKAMGLKNLYIVEDAMGRVVKIFYETELNAFQITAEYGQVPSEKVSAKLEANDYDTKFKVLWVIQPRGKYNPDAVDVLNMPYESLHILEEDKIIVRESGFVTKPVHVGRFYKNEGEEYGRAPGTESIVTVAEVNAIVELITKGAELGLWPALYLLDDGSFGNGVLDRSPMGLTVLDMTSARIQGASPIGPVAETREMQSTFKLLELLVKQIKGHFFVDRLLDLNNETRMTLGEAQIRNELRADSVGGIYCRQMDEVLTPAIRSTIKILEVAGELGVDPADEERVKMIEVSGREALLIPADVLEAKKKGAEIFEIEYISPAARIMRAEELRGVMSTMQFVGTFAPLKPELMLMIDEVKTLQAVRELSGAPSSMLRSLEDFQKALKDWQEGQAQMTELRMREAQAGIAAKEGAARQQNAQADATAAGSGMMGMPMLQ